MKLERLRDLREDRDLTQAQVAKKLNIERRTYSHYELGTREPSLEILIKLADFYNVTLDYLVGRENRKRQ